MPEDNCIDTTTEETCDLKSFERNKYFYGKLMTVRDFETEQRYFNQKRHLINRRVHGVGLVCGLEVSEPKLAGGKLQVKLAKGVALDCCGREIVVEGGVFDLDESPVDGLNYLYLKYKECWKEPVPSLANPSVCEEVCCYSRIKETFTLALSRSAPPAAPSFDWRQVWSDREPDIHHLADESSAVTPQNEIEGKLGVTADEYYNETGCPDCDDPKVLLAAIRLSGLTVTIDEDETLAVRSLVYTNPMLLELLKSHLTDVDNPHHVTAEQTKALMSINNVGNAPESEEWVQNVDIESTDGTITVTPNAEARSIVIKTTHAQINPLEVNPAFTDTPRDKHVSNADANRWNKSPSTIDGLASPGADIDLVAGVGIQIEHPPVSDGATPQIKISGTSLGIASIDSLANPGGDIDLVAGDNITIDHPEVAAGSPPQIRISATRSTDAVTGIIRVTIPKATVFAEITHVVPSAPGHVVVKDILHLLDTELSPAIVLGLVTEAGIIMEQDFFSVRPLVELIGKADGSPVPPPVYFKALKVDNKKFDIVAINLDTQAEATIAIRWWAIPSGREVKELPPIRDITDRLRERLGIEVLRGLADERHISVDEVSNVIGEMINTITAQPTGVTAAEVASVLGVREETINPVLENLAESATLKPTGTATTRRFTINR